MAAGLPAPAGPHLGVWDLDAVGLYPGARGLDLGSGIWLPGAWIPASGRRDVGASRGHPGGLFWTENPCHTTRGVRPSNRASATLVDVRARGLPNVSWTSRGHLVDVPARIRSGGVGKDCVTPLALKQSTIRVGG